MKKYIPWIMILSLCGCSRAGEPGQNTSNAPEKTDGISTEIAPNGENVPEIAPNGENLPVMVPNDGWFHIVRGELEVQKCFDIHGCTDNNQRVLAGVEKKKDETGREIFFCGDNNMTGIVYAAGYRCSPGAGHAVCVQDKCDCGNVQIGYGEFCDGTVENDRFTDNSSKYSLVKTDNAKAENSSDNENNTSDNRENFRICGEKDGEMVDDGMYSDFSCETFEWEGTGGYEQGTFVCMNPKGCRTMDGRKYSPLGFVGNIMNSCAYYVSGNVDTTVETLCRHGDCVIPENVDLGLKLITIAQYDDFKLPGFSVVEKNVDYEFVYDLDDDDSEQRDFYYIPNGAEEYEDEKTFVEGYTVDTRTCEGGVRYCHGRKNKPRPVPANSAGYQCKSVHFMPEFGFDVIDAIKTWVCQDEQCVCGNTKCPKNAACIDEKCYCGDSLVDSDSDYSCEKFIIRSNDKSNDKPFRIPRYCKGSNCACGNTTCSLNMECVDNKCLCADITVPSNDAWICDNAQVGNLRCNNENGCMINGQKYLFNTQYHSDGRMTCRSTDDVRPGNAFECKYNKSETNYSWVCTGNEPCSCYGKTINPGDKCYFLDVIGSCVKPSQLTENSCICDGKPQLRNFQCQSRSDGTTVNVCTRDEGCTCGTNTCQYGMYCIDGKCQVPVLNDDKAALDYWEQAIVKNAEDAVLCKDPNGCFCGADKCNDQTYCLDGKCQPAAFSYVRNGHAFAFDYSGPKDELYDHTHTMLTSPDWITCNENIKENIKNKKEQIVIDFEHSDHFDDYYCDIYKTDCETHDCEDVTYEPSGLECSKPDYCMCGNVRCPKDAACSCNLDENNRIRCGCDAPNAIREVTGQLLECGDSKVIAKQVDGYDCIADLGFVCTSEAACPCGNVSCQKGAVCLSSGNCTGITENLKSTKAEQ